MVVGTASGLEAELGPPPREGLHCPTRKIQGQPKPRKRLERKREGRQRLQEEHGGRNRCCTQNPPRAARLAIKNSHILDQNSHILRELGQKSSSHQY